VARAALGVFAQSVRFKCRIKLIGRRGYSAYCCIISRRLLQSKGNAHPQIVEFGPSDTPGQAEQDCPAIGTDSNLFRTGTSYSMPRCKDRYAVTCKTLLQEGVMNEQLKQPVGVGRLPEDMLTIAQTTVEGAREVFSTASKVASKGTERWQRTALSNFAAAQEIAGKYLENVASNVDATFDAARAIATCKTIPEASAVYRGFIEERFAAAAAQTKDLYALSAKLFEGSVEAAGEGARSSIHSGS
jgi:hypothetical protein